MNPKEKAILREYVGDAQPHVCVESRTRVDTGSWLHRRRVWICVFDEELILIAATRRRFVEKFKCSEISQSYYSHSTGEFIIEPGEGLRFNAFAVSAREALSILQLLKPSPKSTPNPIPSVA